MGVTNIIFREAFPMPSVAVRGQTFRKFFLYCTLVGPTRYVNDPISGPQDGI